MPFAQQQLELGVAALVRQPTRSARWKWRTAALAVAVELANDIGNPVLSAVVEAAVRQREGAPSS